MYRAVQLDLSLIASVDACNVSEELSKDYSYWGKGETQGIEESKVCW